MAGKTQKSKFENTHFWNRTAKGYARKAIADQQAYKTKLGKTDQYLKPKDYVLEIACGTGTTALYHAPKVAQILATDLSQDMIAIAKAKAEKEKVQNVDFLVSSVRSLRVPAGSVDVVLALNIFHLLHNVEGVLQQLHSFLKPGGLLISSTPCIGNIFPLLRYVAPTCRTLGLLPHINVFTEEKLKQWIEGSGFTIEEIWQKTSKNGIYLVAKKEG